MGTESGIPAAVPEESSATSHERGEGGLGIPISAGLNSDPRETQGTEDQQGCRVATDCRLSHDTRRHSSFGEQENGVIGLPERVRVPLVALSQ